MRLSVATNFDPLLIEAVRPYPVVELYGKLRMDAAGGGRAPYQLAPVSRKKLAEHVRDARRAGIGFNYLLNASCLGNREITRAGQAEIETLCSWLREIGVESVTVASPLLLRLVKTRFPSLKVRISVFGGVDRVRKAQMWEEMGADTIVLDSILVNRELASLEKIRKAVRCDLELLANNCCLLGCSMSPAHMNALSHAGQSWHGNGGFLVDWCLLRCQEMKLRDPVNYLRAEWIRPEDLSLYEGMGYDRFKLAERDLPTPVMANRVRAYAARRYDGNLLDLVQPYALRGVDETDRYYRKGAGWYFRFLLRPRLVNPARMLLLKRLADLCRMTRPAAGPAPVFVDNRALDGFMERFREAGCRDQECGECRWCGEFARKAVRVDEAARAEMLAAYGELFRSLDGGDMWRFRLKARDHVGTPAGKRRFNELHFEEAAPRYDTAVKAMSLGLDARWKRRLVADLPDLPAPNCIDLACGTGDVTFLLAARYPGGTVAGVDLVPAMLALASGRNRFGNVRFEPGDMCSLPFPDASADIVTGGYALRNAPDLRTALAETRRVLKEGGVAAFLDFSKTEHARLQRFQYLLLRWWCGLWGRILHGTPEVHGYVADSLEGFPDRRKLPEILREEGFEVVSSRRFFPGVTELLVLRVPAVSGKSGRV